MMLLPQTNYIKCHNGHEAYKMYYTAWGNPEQARKTLICVHGLNRNGRDWDYIGQQFANLGYYVVAPDIVGRGNSDYLLEPKGYDIPFYVADILKLIATLGLRNIDYLGTSMGGLIGMAIASSEYNPLRKLILNDIGAEVEYTGLKRIAAYTDKQLEYASYAEAKAAVINISRSFGNLPDAVWDSIVFNSLQINAKGNYELKRDGNLSKPFLANLSAEKNLDLWAYWQRVTIPTLVVRGAISDILSAATVLKMQQVNPHTKSVEVKDVGHAPFLYNDEHFTFLSEFLA